MVCVDTVLVVASSSVTQQSLNFSIAKRGSLRAGGYKEILCCHIITMVVECPKCHKEFRDNGRLKNHLNSKRACNVESVKHCDECDKTFPSVTHYKRHAESIHGLKFSDVEATIVIQDSQGVEIDQSSGKTVNNINVNVTINFPAVEFGKEKVEDLVSADWAKICGGVTDKREIVISLLKYLNCNDEKPDNHNVLVKDVHATEAYVYTQEDWRKKDCDETMRDCLSNVTHKAQDALYDEAFNKVNPTSRAKIEGCIKVMEEIADQADKADSSIAEDVLKAKQAIVKFTQTHLDLWKVAENEHHKAKDLKKYKPSKVFKGYGSEGVRRKELFEALQQGLDLPALNLDALPK